MSGLRRSPFHFSHNSVHLFELPPERMWEEITQFERYPGWSHWLKDLRYDGQGFAPGTSIAGVVDPPGPLRARLRVTFERAEPPRELEARIEGDLAGRGRLRLEEHPRGTEVTISWEIEVRHSALRLAALSARPFARLVQRVFAHLTAEGFRKHLREEE